MAQVPKFVLQRLAASASPEEHPAADLLAAFIEQQVAGAERERLLTHLAGCAQCREVVWHALPESEAIDTVLVHAAARRRSWVQAWRWVGAAAAVVVVATVALVYRGGPGPAGEKLASAPKPAAVATKADTQTLAANVPLPTTSPQARQKARVPAAPPTVQMEAKAAPLKQRPAEREQAPANQIAAAEKPAQAADVVAGAASRVAPGSAARAETLAGVNLAAAPAANPVPASTTVAGVMVGSTTPALVLGKKKLAPPTRWMLSADGALLRSTDAGENWQTVPFDANVVFRTIAVVGPKVWVAGQGGTLYYSGDDGSQWTRLAIPLQEDIRSLSFLDARHGSLTTAGGQTWVTSDGGRIWHKQ